MKRCVKSEVVSLMLELLTGVPDRTMESAKLLIQMAPSDLDPRFLSRVLGDQSYKEWSRVGAAYILGFIPITPSTEHQYVLRNVLAEKRFGTRLRSHAAEALGNLKDQASGSILKARLFDSGESTSVRKWCIYALSELASAESNRALEVFARSQPKGVLASELHACFGHTALQG